YLEVWRARRVADGDEAWRAMVVAGAAKDTLAALLEARAVRERQERASRLNATTYVMDLLREYNHDQSVEPVLRYIVASGPIAALSGQRGASIDSISAQRVSVAGIQQWQGPAKVFPPLSWLAPGETMLFMPMESGAQQRLLFGVVEGAGGTHLDLDD